MRFIILILALATTGCACVTRGMTDQVKINSNPPEAQAHTSMGHVCVTPCTLQVPVKTQLAGAGAAGFAGNILLGGVVGMGVDVATGATLEHFPNSVTATLLPLKKGEEPTVMKIVPQPPEPETGRN